MIAVTDKQRRMIFALVKSYSNYVYQDDTDFYISKSLKELKKKYQKDCLTDVELPFKNLDKKIKKILEEAGTDVDKITYLIEKMLVREIQFLKIKTDGVFSISTSLFSMKAAQKFISYLISYFVYNNIDISEELIKMLEEKEKSKFVYACLVNKKCCICGREVSFPHHHTSVNAVGGYKNDNGSIPIVPLCKFHHSELHSSINKWEWIKKHSGYGYILCTPQQIKELQKVYKGLFLKDLEVENEQGR